jgi:hypothetical protein
MSIPGDVAEQERAALAATALKKFKKLYICERASDACRRATGQKPPGFAIAVTMGTTASVEWGEFTVFGPVHRTVQVAGPDFYAEAGPLVEDLVFNTLDQKDRDVWLACSDSAIMKVVMDRARRTGIDVNVVPVSHIPSVTSPFDLFSSVKQRAKASPAGGVMSYCTLDPAIHAPLDKGAILRMTAESDDDGGTVVSYTDDNGAFVGLHGRLPFPLAETDRRRLAEVRVEVNGVAWGRTWKADTLIASETLTFELPPDVDMMLADAKLVLEHPSLAVADAMSNLAVESFSVCIKSDAV